MSIWENVQTLKQCICRNLSVLHSAFEQISLENLMNKWVLRWVWNVIMIIFSLVTVTVKWSVPCSLASPNQLSFKRKWTLFFFSACSVHLIRNWLKQSKLTWLIQFHTYVTIMKPYNNLPCAKTKLLKFKIYTQSLSLKHLKSNYYG